jgi:hypothetical protein
MIERAAEWGARSALASGLLSLIGLVFLLLFYGLEAPSLMEAGTTDRWVLFGRTNDALVGLAALAAIPLAARLHGSWRARAPGLSAAALAVGVAAMLLIGATQLAYAAALIPSAIQAALIGVLFVGIGAWLAVVNLGPADPALRSRLRWLGVATGVGYVLVALIALLYASTGGGDPAVVFANPLVALAAGLGLLGSNVGYPVWAIWLGRRLVREDTAAGR